MVQMHTRARRPQTIAAENKNKVFANEYSCDYGRTHSIECGKLAILQNHLCIGHFYTFNYVIEHLPRDRSYEPCIIKLITLPRDENSINLQTCTKSSQIDVGQLLY